MNPYGFSQREEEVAQWLCQGKSNKQIAVILKISESTVEFHLTHIYEKLGVSSRAEAILIQCRLGETPGVEPAPHLPTPGETPVANPPQMAHNQGNSPSQALPGDEMSRPARAYWQKRKGMTRLAVFTLLLLLAALVVYLLLPKGWRMVRECEFPGEATVGKLIPRSQAYGSGVLGQFGSQAAEPWDQQSGSVTYQNILTPKLDALYLTLRYSKDSPASVPILIYLDGSHEPSAAFYPQDQGDWNHFAWSEQLSLGSVEGGMHSLSFTTDGQQYGVADLDRFILMAGSP